MSIHCTVHSLKFKPGRQVETGSHIERVQARGRHNTEGQHIPHWDSSLKDYGHVGRSSLCSEIG